MRLWAEDLGGGQIEWRGQVQHVLSGEVRWFRAWEELEAHLRALALQAARAASSETSAQSPPTAIGA